MRNPEEIQNEITGFEEFRSFLLQKLSEATLCLNKHSEEEKEGNFPETRENTALPWLCAQTQCFPWPEKGKVYILLLKASTLDTLPADMEPGLRLKPFRAETSKHYWLGRNLLD